MKGREVQGEMLKMLFVVREIRTVLQAIIKGKNDGVVSENIMDAYIEELETILGYLKQMPTEGRKGERANYSRSSIAANTLRQNGEIIMQCQQDDKSMPSSPLKSSGAFQIRLKDRYGQPGPQMSVGQLVELNHNLSEQNDYLEEKLKQAEDYIRKLDGQRSLLIKEVEHLRQSPARIQYEKDPVFFRLNVEIQRLKNELTETSQFIVKNNQQFIDQIQRYNESIWKLQHEVENLKGSLQEATEVIRQQHCTIEDMRKQEQQQPSVIGYHKEKRATSRDPSGRETERIDERASSIQAKPYLLKDRNEITLKRRLSPETRLP